MNLTFSGDDPVFSINVNEPFVSLAFYTSPKVAVEPSATLSFLATDGGTVLVALLGVNVPIYSQETWGRSGFYFSPGLDIIFLGTSGGGGNTATQLGLGMDVGTKIPVMDAVSFKVGGGAAYRLENDTFSDGLILSGLVGISVFFP
jgi:hypothetical protein